jgi:hypothetical protein
MRSRRLLEKQSGRQQNSPPLVSSNHQRQQVIAELNVEEVRELEDERRLRDRAREESYEWERRRSQLGGLSSIGDPRDRSQEPYDNIHYQVYSQQSP